MIPVLLIFITVVAYLAGTINCCTLMSRFLYQKDVRTRGNHKATYANFGRVFGKKAMALPIIGDGVVCVITILLGAGIMMIPRVDFPLVGRLYAGFIFTIGSMFPFQNNLRGLNKGYVPCFITLCCTDWRIGVAVIVVFLLVLVFSQYLSLALMSGCATGMIAAWIVVSSEQCKGMCGVIAMIMAILVIWRNRGTVFRLIAHKEKKIRWSKKPETVLRTDRNF